MRGKKTLYNLNNPGLDKDDVYRYEAIFHNANGYLGVRYNFEEGYPDDYNVFMSQYINGVYDYTDMPQAENLYGLVDEKQTMLAVASTQEINLSVEGERFSMFEGEILEWSLNLDMEKGITIREVKWRSPKGKEIFLKTTRMTSFDQLCLFLIEYEVTPLNFDGEIIIESVHDGNATNYFNPDDPRTAAISSQYIFPASSREIKGGSYITSRTKRSGIEICSAVKNLLSCECERQLVLSNDKAVCTIKVHAKQGKCIKLDKYSVLCDSLRYGDTTMQAREEMSKAMAHTTEALHKKHEKRLAEYWDNCNVEIIGDKELSDALEFNMYHLYQSVSRDSFGGIAPKGLSGEGYEGHFFWDTEMFIQPFFTITNPSISKTLLESRYRQLPLARENAKILGHKKGALYPWRTIIGSECSGYYPSGSAQYHINGDIAYAIIAYYLATKDIDFMAEKGAEIIFETARVWIDMGVMKDDMFHINDVSGPDEYTCIVNNNYYTNILAQYHLRWAVKFYNMLKKDKKITKLKQKLKLKEREIEEFYEVAAKMYLPYDEKLGINPQDDSFLNKKEWDIASIPTDNFPLLMHYHPLHIYRHKICKQADTIMAYFILEDEQSRETMIRSFNYYEKITAHDSSLSKPIFSIVASRLGMEEKAYSYFGDSAKLDLMDLHKNTRDGIHTSNMAGSFMTVVYGFGGFRLKEDGIFFSPILPKKWTRYCFEIVFEGSGIKVWVYKSSVVLSLEKGEPKEVNVYGAKYMLNEKLTIRRTGEQEK